MGRLDIHPELQRARQPPPAFFTDPEIQAALRERVLARSWQWLADAASLEAKADLWPLTLLPGSLDEPILLCRGEDGALSARVNACTHRGHPLQPGPGGRSLRCPYHGRRFDRQGRCLGQPFLDGQPGFPAEADHLPKLPLERWGRFLFTSVDPAFPFEEVLAPLQRRLGFLPLDQAVPEPDGCRDYLVEAPWQLYCDNYLEGLHIPFVHPSLNAVLQPGGYRHELLPWGTLQIGTVGPDEPAFDLPPDHPDAGLGDARLGDAGQRVGAFYFFVFPNLMVNAYPWGLQLNLVQPLGPARTRVRYLAWTLAPELRGRGAGGDLHTVELEDEAVVEAVAAGLRARRARTGGYVPGHEDGLHHIHRLLAGMLG